MGEKGYDLLKERYNWKIIAKKTLEVYAKVIESMSLQQEKSVENCEVRVK